MSRTAATPINAKPAKKAPVAGTKKLPGKQIARPKGSQSALQNDVGHRPETPSNASLTGGSAPASGVGAIRKGKYKHTYSG